ncbi:MAG: hypothetical protein ACPHID_05255 [Thermoplasmatota archaeon]
MDDKGLGLIAIIAMAAGGLIVLLAAIGGILYMTDTAVEATVIDKDCSSSPLGATSQITVKTKFPIPGIEHTIKEFDNTICNGLRAGEDGNYAKYYLKSERTVLFEREGGQCLYDSNGIKCDSS